MLCRAVLTAVAISYLICVLWLSGMQKEDLDVNMLRKLQRHNVNIDDMSPESLKQQCLDFTVEKENETKRDKSTDDENLTTEQVKLDSEKHIKNLLKNDLKYILDDLMDKKTTKTVDENSFSTKTDVTSNLITNSPLPTANVKNKHNDIFNGELSPFEGHLNEKLLSAKYGNDQPKIKDIGKFWQMFTSTTSSYKSPHKKIKKQHSNPRPNEETHEQNKFETDSNKNRSKEIDYIKTIIADLIGKKVTTEKPTTVSVDLKKLSDQIDKLLKLYPQSSTGVPPSNSNTLRESEIEYDKPKSVYFTKNSITEKKSVLDGGKQYDNSAKNEKIYINRVSPILFSKKEAYFSEIVPELTSNDRQTEMFQRYQTVDENKLDIYQRRVPVKYNKEIQIQQKHSTLKENDKIATFPNIMPVQDSNDKAMDTLYRYQTKDRNKMTTFPNIIPEQASDDREMEMLQRYQTIEGIKINSFPNKFVNDKDIEIPQKYQTRQGNNKEASFLNWIPVQNSNKEISQSLQSIEANKMGNNIPNKIPMYAPEDQKKIFDNYQMLRGENKIASVPVQSAAHRPIQMQQKYPSIEGNKVATMPKITSAQTLDNTQSELLQGCQTVERNAFTVFQNKIPAQTSDGKQRETLKNYPPMERNKVPSFLIDIPLQAPDNKRWEKYQSIYMNQINSEPTHVPSTEIATVVNNDTKKTEGSVLIKNCIKEIAENVKAILLKDLRKEMALTTTIATTTTAAATTTAASTTTAAASTTTTAVTTTTVSRTKPAKTDKTTTNQPLKRLARENPPENKTQEATQVMAKFMALFEQFKDIKEKTENDVKKKKLSENVSYQDINIPFNANHPLAPVVGREPYRVKRPPEETPILSPFAIQIPRLIKKIPLKNVNFMQMSPMMPMTTPQRFPRLQAKPITIQTNSDEVKPLGIPLTKPLNLIHQNIVVTTTRPATVSQRFHPDKWVEQYENKDEANRKEKYKNLLKPSAPPYLDAAKNLGNKLHKSNKLDSRDRRFREKKTFNPNRYDRLLEFKHQLKDDMDKMSYNHGRQGEFKSKKYDRLYYKEDGPEFKDVENIYKVKNNRPYESSRSYQDQKKRGLAKSPYNAVSSDEQKHFDDASYGALHSNNRNPKRFHEKLERVDDWDNIESGKPDAVASRHQQPLNMKDPRFDDTHFQNFLKTQQKVNEMLEKILSSKTRTMIGPQSVETT